MLIFRELFYKAVGGPFFQKKNELTKLFEGAFGDALIKGVKIFSLLLLLETLVCDCEAWSHILKLS